MIAAVSVVRAALIVKVPIPGESERTIRLVTDYDIADPSAQSAPTCSISGAPKWPPHPPTVHLALLDLAGTIFTSRWDMARPAKQVVKKAERAKVSRKMREVRPLRGAPAIGRRYDPGFKEPPETKSPWADEGRPEMGED